MKNNDHLLNSSQVQPRQDPMVWLLRMMHDFGNKGYYGKVEITFEAGKMVHLEKRESMKPPR